MKIQVNTKKIKDLREQRGWSQDLLAQMSGISLRTLQRMEKDGNCSIESVKSLAAVFEVDFKEILHEEDHKKFEGTDFLFKIKHGKQISDLIGEKHAGDCDFDISITDKDSLELVHELFQSVMDYNDIWDSIEFGGRTDAIIYFQELIDKLHQKNLWVFGGATQREEGNFKPPLIFDVIVLRVFPKDSPDIIKIDLNETDLKTTNLN